MKVILFIVALIVFTQSLPGQSLTGNTGLFNIPSGEIAKDGTISLGLYYLTPSYFDNKQISHVSIGYFGSVVFLPFMELGVRFTKQTGIRDALGDRMLIFKLNFLKESKYLPSAVFGMQDFLHSTESRTNRFNSTYIVLTKNINIYDNQFLASITAGYGSDIIAAKEYQFKGFFGGVSLHYSNLMEIIFENDAKYFNTGVRIKLLNHVQLLGGYINMKYFDGGISFNFVL